MAPSNEPNDLTPPPQPAPAETTNQDPFSADRLPALPTNQTDADGEPSTTATTTAAQFSTPAQPAAAHTPEAAPFVAPPKRNKKKLVIASVIGVVVAVMLAAGSVFAFWYNKPENVVLDALQKAVTASSGEFDGTLSANSQDDVEADLAVTYSLMSNSAGESSGSSDITVNLPDEDDINLKTAFASSKEGDLYLKVENARSLLEQYLGMLGSGDTEMFEGLIAKLDNKWVVITKEDLEELGQSDDQETVCVQDAIKTFQTDEAQQKELEDAYRKNNFFIIDGLGSETVNGRFSNHYSVTVDKAKAKNFALALPESRVFKAVDECVEDDFVTTWRELINDEAATDDTNAEENVEIWIDMWSHELTKVKLSASNKDDGLDIVADANLRFNTNPSVTIPVADTTVDDLREEAEKIENALMQSFDETASTQSFEDNAYTTDDSFNPAVLGLSALRR